MASEVKTGGTLAAEISNALVALHREYYGKGPTKAKTYLLDDHVLVVLSGGMTRVEETLTGRGHADLVMDVRRAFQDAMHDEFKRALERLTAREVRVYISQFDPHAGITLEFFTLAPSGEL